MHIEDLVMTIQWTVRMVAALCYIGVLNRQVPKECACAWNEIPYSMSISEEGVANTLDLRGYL